MDERFAGSASNVKVLESPPSFFVDTTRTILVGELFNARPFAESKNKAHQYAIAFTRSVSAARVKMILAGSCCDLFSRAFAFWRAFFSAKPRDHGAA